MEDCMLKRKLIVVLIIITISILLNCLAAADEQSNQIDALKKTIEEQNIIIIKMNAAIEGLGRVITKMGNSIDDLVIEMRLNNMLMDNRNVKKVHEIDNVSKTYNDDNMFESKLNKFKINKIKKLYNEAVSFNEAEVRSLSSGSTYRRKINNNQQVTLKFISITNGNDLKHNSYDPFKHGFYPCIES